jgi:ABC-2 type transport system ATP-binding protein
VDSVTIEETSMDDIILTRQLRRSFGKGDKIVDAVRGIDLRVASGEVFGFLGPNGAGKTTTLRMLATLLPPSGGEATVAGCDLRRDASRVRERIGYVSQAGGSDPLETGRRELVLQGRLYGQPRAEAEQRAAALLTLLDLQEAADRKTGTYSGGQRRRLDIAMGMIHRPQLLFLDEPTTGLDPQARARVWEEVARLRETGTTVFLTTHYLDEADALCDRVAIIDHGRIVAEGTPLALKQQVAGDVVTISVEGAHDGLLDLLGAQSFVREVSVEGDTLRLYVDQGDQALPAVLRLLDGAGRPPTSLAVARPSLDDVFLRKTGRSLREAAA